MSMTYRSSLTAKILHEMKKITSCVYIREAHTAVIFAAEFHNLNRAIFRFGDK